MSDDHADWPVLGSDRHAWFGASSHAHAAALAVAVAELGGPSPDLAVRADGVRVVLGRADDRAGAISAAARDLGLTADPGVPQELRLLVESPDPAAVVPFWRTALGRDDDGTDPWRRSPAVRFERSDEPRPLRNRVHVDSGHPGPTDGTRSALAALGGRETFTCQWYSTVADPDGNEIDVIPGGDLAEESTADWRAMFGGMAAYPGTSPARLAELAVAAGGLADAAGIPLMIDLRADGVVFDSGKDQWEEVAGFVDLAAAVQGAARAAGFTADTGRLRFVQVGIDALDVPAVLGFWRTVLGYVPAPNTQVTDLFDPRQLNPVVFIQPMEATETERRRQRNRTRIELLVPAGELRARVDTALAVGGRVLDPGGVLIADPEGNELVLRG